MLRSRTRRSRTSTDDVDIVITQQQLTDRAKQKAPHAQHVSVDNFMASPKYDELVDEVKASQGLIRSNTDARKESREHEQGT